MTAKSLAHRLLTEWQLALPLAIFFLLFVFAPLGLLGVVSLHNDMAIQEPGTAQEIATFCKLTYDVTFPMFEKVVTKGGAQQSPIYAFLGQSGKLPAWNFSKYVVDKQGRITAFFPSEVTPEDPKLRDAIAKALAN